MQMFGQGFLVVLLAVRDGVPQLAPLYLGLVGLARADRKSTRLNSSHSS